MTITAREITTELLSAASYVLKIGTPCTDEWLDHLSPGNFKTIWTVTQYWRQADGLGIEKAEELHRKFPLAGFDQIIWLLQQPRLTVEHLKTYQ